MPLLTIKPKEITKEKIIAMKRARAKKPEILLDRKELSRRSQALTKIPTKPPLRSVLGGRGGKTLTARTIGRRTSTNIIDRRKK